MYIFETELIHELFRPATFDIAVWNARKSALIKGNKSFSEKEVGR